MDGTLLQHELRAVVAAGEAGEALSHIGLYSRDGERGDERGSPPFFFFFIFPFFLFRARASAQGLASVGLWQEAGVDFPGGFVKIPEEGGAEPPLHVELLGLVPVAPSPSRSQSSFRWWLGKVVLLPYRSPRTSKNSGIVFQGGRLPCPPQIRRNKSKE